MRILLITDFFPPVFGGLEFHVDGLAAELARRGHEVCVATLTDNPVASSDAVRIHSLPSLARALPHERADRPFHPPLPEPVARRALGAVVRDFRPDVIHGHSWLSVSLPRGLTAPVVFTAHDYALICQLRTLLHPDGSCCTGPALAKCIACGTPAYGRAKSQLLTRGTVAGRRRFPAARILAVSGAVRDALEPHVDVPVEIVPNFVAPEPDGWQDAALPASIPPGPFAMYAGDGGAHKGVPDLLDAWRPDGGQPACPLVIATPRPLDRPIPPGVVAVSLTRAQVAAAWRRASVALVPSRWADPCPTVVLEALRAGTPVIGTRVGGIPEMVRDDMEGLLVEPRDPAALRSAVARLVGDDGLRDRLAGAARERAVSFGVGPVTDRIEGSYARALASAPQEVA